MKLNGATIPDDVVQRVIERRGTAHPFAALEPAKTALVVVDMQNAFMDEAMGHAVCPAARDIVPAINRLAEAVRQAGGGIFWIKTTCDERSLREWSVAHEMSSPKWRAKRIAALAKDSPGHQLWPALDVRPEDEIVEKTRFSGFFARDVGTARPVAGPRL